MHEHASASLDVPPSAQINTTKQARDWHRSMEARKSRSVSNNALTNETLILAPPLNPAFFGR